MEFNYFFLLFMVFICVEFVRCFDYEGVDFMVYRKGSLILGRYG